MNQAKIGSFLKELRKEKNLTQEQFAEQLGISNRTVSRWETGNNMPDISLLTEIAEFYDVSIPELINGERKSEKMKEDVKEVADKMADYAVTEKTNMIKSVRNQSFLGVSALVILFVVDMVAPTVSSTLVDTIRQYCETLIYVSVVLICLLSTGLLYKFRKGKKELGVPKPILVVIAAVIAFGVAAVLKYFVTLFL